MNMLVSSQYQPRLSSITNKFFQADQPIILQYSNQIILFNIELALIILHDTQCIPTLLPRVVSCTKVGLKLADLYNTLFCIHLYIICLLRNVIKNKKLV